MRKRQETAREVYATYRMSAAMDRLALVASDKEKRQAVRWALAWNAIGATRERRSESALAAEPGEARLPTVRCLG